MGYWPVARRTPDSIELRRGHADDRLADAEGGAPARLLHHSLRSSLDRPVDRTPPSSPSGRDVAVDLSLLQRTTSARRFGAVSLRSRGRPAIPGDFRPGVDRE